VNCGTPVGGVRFVVQSHTVVILLPTCPSEVMVLRETDPQATIWELLLPEVARRLPTELAAVDASWTTNAS
jgi:hypothetical protein